MKVYLRGAQISTRVGDILAKILFHIDYNSMARNKLAERTLLDPGSFGDSCIIKITPRNAQNAHLRQRS